MYHFNFSCRFDMGQIGEFTAEVWLFLLITLPMTLVGIYLGNRMFRGLSELTFRRLVSVTLILSGSRFSCSSS
jgi:uncharacterized membrane protein YfcA